MRIVAIAHRGDRREPEDFASRPDTEPAHVMKLYTEGKIRGLIYMFTQAPHSSSSSSGS